MNPFTLSWLWRAVRGRSLTFALVFVLAVAGLSAPRLIRAVLELLPVPWLIAWLAPLIILGLLVKLEPRIIPSETTRGRIAMGIVAATVFIVLYNPDPSAAEPVEPDTEIRENGEDDGAGRADAPQRSGRTGSG